MSSVLKKSALFAAAFLVGATGSARAAVIDVKVPFPFVVRGETLPAGQYRIEIDEMHPAVVLIRGEHGTKANVFVMTNPASGQDPAGDRPVLTFKRDETRYRLADIWDGEGQGREIVAKR